MESLDEKHPFLAVLILSIFGVIGIGLLYMTGFFEAIKEGVLKTYFLTQGFVVAIAFLFIGVTIYAWISFIKNYAFKPKEKVLYLLKCENKVGTFIDEEGNAYLMKKCNKEVGKHYNVLKTSNMVKKVLGEAGNAFSVPLEKKRYWLNFYSPMENHENVLILPVVYTILVAGISLVLAGNLNGLPFVVLPIILIIYDFVYKIKLRENNNSPIDTSKMVKAFFMSIKFFEFLGALAITGVLIFFYLKADDSISKITLLAFCLIAGSLTIRQFFAVFDSEKLVNIFDRLLVVVVLLFWFGMLTVFTQVAAEQGIVFALLTIPFWFAGVYCIYKYLIKKENKKSS